MSLFSLYLSTSFFVDIYFDHAFLVDARSFSKRVKKYFKKRPFFENSSETLSDVSPLISEGIKIKSHGGSTRATLSLEESTIRAKPRFKKRYFNEPSAICTSEMNGTALVRVDELEASKEGLHLSSVTRQWPHTGDSTGIPLAVDVESGEEMTSTSLPQILPFYPIILEEEPLAESTHESELNPTPIAVENPMPQEFENITPPPISRVEVCFLSFTRH